VLAALTTSLLVTACTSTGDGNRSAPVPPTSAGPGTSTPLAPSTTLAEPVSSPGAGTTPPKAATLEVKGRDYAFDDLPGTVAVGSKITFRNTSAKEVHEIVVFRLPDTEKRTAQQLAALPTAEVQALFTGPPVLVLVAPPNASGFAAVGDGTINAPGRYLAFCSIPIGIDPAEYLAAAAKSKGGPVNLPGGPPHFTAGMYADFTAR
jgi:plastocyanin